MHGSCYSGIVPLRCMYRVLSPALTQSNGARRPQGASAAAAARTFPHLATFAACFSQELYFVGHFTAPPQTLEDGKCREIDAAFCHARRLPMLKVTQVRRGVIYR